MMCITPSPSSCLMSSPACIHAVPLGAGPLDSRVACYAGQLISAVVSQPPRCATDRGSNDLPRMMRSSAALLAVPAPPGITSSLCHFSRLFRHQRETMSMTYASWGCLRSACSFVNRAVGLDQYQYRHCCLFAVESRVHHHSGPRQLLSTAEFRQVSSIVGHIMSIVPSSISSHGSRLLMQLGLQC
ncbi:hypothetical protein VTN02DRAFT_550 [Thermoascus thermophilus]